MKITNHGPAFLLIVLLSLSWTGLARAQDSILARTPPMGWNSWNHFACEVSDSVVRAQADAIVGSGMKSAGYVYVLIDDCWQGSRDASGYIRPNAKFPDMKRLADYVHRRGLKMGIYSSPGPRTCEGYAGSYGHEEQDAQTYADWGMDYLKYDLCSYDGMGDQVAAYKRMGDALKKTGRPMVYAMCQYGMQKSWEWGASVGGNLWRTDDDIRDNYYVMAELGFGQNGLEQFAGPGHWNDPDMLEIGNGGMTTDEYRTHMSLWCILAAPLMAGNNLADMDAQTQALLTNPEVSAQSQKTQTSVCNFDDGKQVSVRYQPDISNHKLSEGKVWSPGGSPMFLFTSTLDVSNSKIAIGAYSMYLIRQRDNWTLVLNKNVNPERTYEEHQDLLRDAMEAGQLSASQPFQLIFAHVEPKDSSNMRCVFRVRLGLGQSLKNSELDAAIVRGHVPDRSIVFGSGWDF